MKTFIRNFFFNPILLFVLTVGFASCTSSAQNEANDRSLAMDNYRSYCASCHGKNFERFVDKAWMYESGTSLAEKGIKYGLPKVGMPAFEEAFTVLKLKSWLSILKKKFLRKKISKLILFT